MQRLRAAGTLMLGRASFEGLRDYRPRIVPRAGAAAAAAELRNGDGGDILVFGSRTMWNGLLVAGLVDELHVMVGPALLGAGTALFGGSAPVPLRLLESRVLDGSSLILARYAPSPAVRSWSPGR